MDDKSWVLIRGFNTENVIRVSAESKNDERSKSLVQDYIKRITAIASELSKEKSS